MKKITLGCVKLRLDHYPRQDVTMNFIPSA